MARGIRITIPTALWGNATRYIPGSAGEARYSVFKDSEGFFFDPYDKRSLFQDVSGSIPVEEDGDPVALMLDKSGNGWHARNDDPNTMPTFREEGGRRWIRMEVSEYLVAHSPKPGMVFQSPRTILAAVEDISGGSRKTMYQNMTPESGTGFHNIDMEISRQGHLRAGLMTREESDTLSPDPLVYSEPQVWVGTYWWEPNIYTKYEMRINGAQVADAADISNSGGTAGNAVTIGVNRNYSNGIAANYFGGFYVQRAASVAQVKKAEGYFAERMGLSL